MDQNLNRLTSFIENDLCQQKRRCSREKKENKKLLVFSIVENIRESMYPLGRV
ncbi:hypothetical protein BSM4216_3790 [Bacillus smithii]|nr:hypothetical protein BSM4216_3790 [Bacillus smithii]